jgi:hypothetical protein
MLMRTAELGTKNRCAGEDPQQFIRHSVCGVGESCIDSRVV